jgi:hypothetical protein
MARYFVFILVVLTFSVGCKKNYVLKGRVMKFCGVPYAYEEVSLRVGGKMYGESFSATSDANGYFEIPYESNKNRRIILKQIMSDIPAGNLDLGNVYYALTYSAEVSLQVNNSYTSNDTLLIEGTKYPGPFHSGVIDTLTNLIMPTYEENLAEYGTFKYPGNVKYSLISNGVVKRGSADPFEFEICDGIYHLAVIVIE